VHGKLLEFRTFFLQMGYSETFLIGRIADIYWIALLSTARILDTATTDLPVVADGVVFTAVTAVADAAAIAGVSAVVTDSLSGVGLAAQR
jgi:hypothetical protein